MNEEPVLPELNPTAVPGKSLRFILPNMEGDAIGEIKDPKNIDTESMGFAMPGRTAMTVRYGVAFVPHGTAAGAPTATARAAAGAQGAAIVHRGGRAEAGDSGMAYAWTGDTEGGWWATTYSLTGASRVLGLGVAVLQSAGSATVGTGGVACALNFKIENGKMVTDPTVGIVSGGAGSVVVAFGLNAKGERMPVVGFIGEEPAWLNATPDLAAQLSGSGVQFGLLPGKRYRLNSKSNVFELVKSEVEGG
jgi:hypothetical protein